LHLALVLPISKRHQENKVLFDESGETVKRLSSNTIHTISLLRICHLLNMLNGFKILLENQLAARLKNFQITVGKTC